MGKITIEFIRELSAEDVKDWRDIYKEDLEFSKSKKLTYAERKALPDNMFAVVLRVKKKRGEGYRKIRMFPIHDETHVRNALSRLGQKKVQATLKKLGISKEKVLKKILRRAKELGMTQLLERHKSSLFSEEELIEKIEQLQKEIEQYKSSIETLEKEKAELEKNNQNLTQEKEKLEKEKEKLETEVKKEQEKAKLYKEKGELIAKRRAELGEFAKDLSDEDLLDDTKYELARLRKENYELRQKSGDLETGHSGGIDDEIEQIKKEVWEKKKY